MFDEGQAAFLAGRFLDAARAFDDAFAESKEPKLLWNVAQAYRRQYEVDHDVTNLRRAVVVFRNYSQTATTEIERREADLAAMEAAGQIDEAERAAVATRSTTTAHALAPGTREKGSRVPGFVVAGGGLALAGAGAVLGLLARSEASMVHDAGTPQNPALFSTVASDYSRGQALATAAYVCFGVAAGAIVAGSVLAIVRPRLRTREAAVVRVDRNGVGVAW